MRYAILAALCLRSLLWSQWFIHLPEGPRKDTDSLISHAARQQGPLSAWLDSRKVRHRRYWVVNSIYLPQASAGLLEELRAAGYEVTREEIIRLDLRLEPDAAPWGVARIRAPELWQRGVTGSRAMVAVIDTGIDPHHPDLSPAWTGYWFDPANICGGSPCDNTGHGTHVSGTIAGRNGIGVAPGARLAACKGCESSWCSQSSLLACAQWVLTLPEKPVAVNNSWGGGYFTWYRQAVAAWLAAGIMPVFAAGNPGSYCGGVNAPGAYCEALATGATDSADAIAGFSGRGPSPEGCIKPDVSAPGVGIHSTLPGGSYGSLSGTSMAAPHVSGAAALLSSRSVDPLRLISTLRDTARRRPATDCDGGPDCNNVYGCGIIDVVAAYDRLGAAPPPPNRPPVVRIIEPADGAALVCGAPLRFRAMAADSEDGDLSDSIVWWGTYPFWKGPTAERVGPAGIGCELGWHIIRAEVQDSAGASASAEVRVLMVKGAL